jgi:uncharacterized YigZ family protein
MTAAAAYFIPAETICVEQEIRHSRFIAIIGHARGREEAHRFISETKHRRPGADHYCWAYMAGNPAETMDIGMNDDGEPQGTAGRPMLNLLRHRNIGEIVVVVVRFFGGTKLGTGGLARAYAGTVQKALDQLSLRECIPCRTLCLETDFADEDALRRLIDEKGFSLEDIRYTQNVKMTVKIPVGYTEDFRREALNRSRGRVKITNAEETASVRSMS